MKVETYPDELAARILPKDLAAALGEFIVNVSGAQYIVVAALRDLMAGKSLSDHDDQTASLVLIGMDANIHLGLLKSLAGVRLQKDAEEVEKICDLFAGFNQIRNALAHGLWETSRKPSVMVAVSLQVVGKVKQKRTTVSARYLIQRTFDLHRQLGRLVELMQRNGYLRDLDPPTTKYYE